ncbi:anther-specific proline-rich protein APG-like isoform X1 [Heterocephalus glaber]|uniref:Anther-specific proline-rich protein APG-like isoform X1 n=1 Tax=Heterocephalus glaber TaxID=10181 RepID=A0AAX6T449_HETGA|nr:anther-specific proline-rich protein APG-like isoform X1 [Heterocephalus glaber]
MSTEAPRPQPRPQPRQQRAGVRPSAPLDSKQSHPKCSPFVNPDSPTFGASPGPERVPPPSSCSVLSFPHVSLVHPHSAQGPSEASVRSHGPELRSAAPACLDLPAGTPQVGPWDLLCLQVCPAPTPTCSPLPASWPPCGEKLSSTMPVCHAISSLEPADHGLNLLKLKREWTSLA